MGICTFGLRAIIDCADPSAPEGVEDALRKRGVLSEGERLLHYEEVRDFVRAGGESYGAVFRVEAEGRSGCIARRTVYAKAIVTGFGAAADAAARTQVGRFRLLSAWGIRTPRVYGSGKGTIYMECIEGATPSTGRHLGELSRIAAVLDVRGAHPIDFLSDLVERGDELFYVDAGGDLGYLADGLPPNADRPALRTLLASLPGADRFRAEELYARHGGAR